MNYLSNKLAQVLVSPTLPTHRKSGSVNPSAASIKFIDVTGRDKVVGGCHRQSFYKMTGVPKDDGAKVNVDWTLAAMMGESLHDLLGKVLDEHGFGMGIQRLAEEHSFYDPATKLSGRTDLIAWDYNSDEPIGIEVKSLGEYKCKTAVNSPVEEHVLQSVVYLDHYNKNIPEGQKKITKWYIWYISRTENWTIKAKPHGSEFAMLWDYCIELDDGVPIVHLGSGVSQRWSQFAISEIYDRYAKLIDEVAAGTIPARDFEQTYSEETILGMHKAGQISRKMDRDAIDRWVKKGAPAGKLKVTLGDGACMFCEYSKLCWEGAQAKKKKAFSNLPLHKASNSDDATPGKDKKYFL
tara:strand:- start:161019 stop:162074 length:1056 start_codon:yes stop_codon:yes gene_type:complete